MLLQRPEYSPWIDALLDVENLTHHYGIISKQSDDIERRSGPARKQRFRRMDGPNSRLNSYGPAF